MLVGQDRSSLTSRDHVIDEWCFLVVKELVDNLLPIIALLDQLVFEEVNERALVPDLRSVASISSQQS